MIPVYKSYAFKDKDPAIDQIRTAVQKQAGSRERKDMRRVYKHIHESGGPTPGCLVGWFEGGTCRPQFASLNAAARVLGMEWRLVKIRKDNK
jgi:hypothetical protein